MKSRWQWTFSGCVVEQQSTPVVSSLIETVDRVMDHMVTNMEPTSTSLFSLGGASSVAGQKWVSSVLLLSRWVIFSTLHPYLFLSLFSTTALNFLTPTDYSLMKFSQNFNLPNYRFPTQGRSYISVPGEAFAMQSKFPYIFWYRTAGNCLVIVLKYRSYIKSFLTNRSFSVHFDLRFSAATFVMFLKAPSWAPPSFHNTVYH